MHNEWGHRAAATHAANIHPSSFRILLTFLQFIISFCRQVLHVLISDNCYTSQYFSTHHFLWTQWWEGSIQSLCWTPHDNTEFPVDFSQVHSAHKLLLSRDLLQRVFKVSKATCFPIFSLWSPLVVTSRKSSPNEYSKFQIFLLKSLTSRKSSPASSHSSLFDPFGFFPFFFTKSSSSTAPPCWTVYFNIFRRKKEGCQILKNTWTERHLSRI